MGGRVLELSGIVLLESRTGRGIGSALLSQMKEAAREAGFSRMVVHTESYNERAIAFYKRHGFSLETVVKEEVRGSPIELAVLHLDLAAE